MRLLELSLCVTIVLGQFLLVLRLIKGAPSSVILVVILLGLSLAHVVFDGVRWMLVPTYIASGTMLIYLSLSSAGVFIRPGTPVLSISMSTLTIVLALLGIFLACAFPVFSPSFNNGPYNIGSQRIEFVRPVTKSPLAQDVRHLTVEIFYPQRRDTKVEESQYLDADVAKMLAELQGKPSLLLAHLQLIKTQVSRGAIPLDVGSSLPTIVFVEGLTGYRQMNTYQVSRLVSHGFAVICIDQQDIAAYVSTSSGEGFLGFSKKQVDPLIAPSLEGRGNSDTEDLAQYYADDISFVVDQIQAMLADSKSTPFFPSLNLKKVGLVGVSFGGIIGAVVCATDSRFSAFVSLDSPMPKQVTLKGLKIPAMWISRNSEAMLLERSRSGGWTDKDIEQTNESIDEAYKRSEADAFLVRIEGVFHIDFTDLSLISPFAPALGLSGPNGGRQAHSIINDFTLLFFQSYLTETKNDLSGLVGKYGNKVDFMKRVH